MILAPDEAALFYRVWWPLLAWVNEQRRIVPAFPVPTPERPLPVAVAEPIRSALWADDRLLDQYLATRGSTLAPAERELIASWKRRQRGSFIVFKHLREHSIFLGKDVFGVLGLYSPIAELVATVPAYVDAVLLPFGDRIVIDGILSSPGVQLMFGRGMRKTFSDQYANARARSQIRTSLLASPARAKRPARAKPQRQSMIGTWRITHTDLWDREALDQFEPAVLHIARGHRGELRMIAMSVELDHRIEDKQRIDFSFVGDDDGSPCAGRGWALLGDDDVLRGHLYFHGGDDSAFVAERVVHR